jgi:hypothetical protein
LTPPDTHSTPAATAEPGLIINEIHADPTASQATLTAMVSQHTQDGSPRRQPHWRGGQPGGWAPHDGVS